VHFFRPAQDFDAPPRQILSGVTWQVAPGALAAILGANGSGKSTLLRIGCGYLWPQRGRVELLGKVLGETPVAPLRARLGIVEATTVYPFDDGITALEVVVTGYFSALTLGYVHPTPEQFEHARALLEQVGLGHKGGQMYYTLSTGERLRCLLARALVRKPDLLLLDEPTAGLDLPARETLLATLTRLHKAAGAGGAGGGAGGHAPAILTITHHLEELLPGTTNILLLSTAGTVVAQGAPETVLTETHLSAAYGLPIHVTHRHGRYTAHVDPRTWEDLL
jgi:iron complex transport system ATP-binding protein